MITCQYNPLSIILNLLENITPLYRTPNAKEFVACLVVVIVLFSDICFDVKLIRSWFVFYQFIFKKNDSLYISDIIFH